MIEISETNRENQVVPVTSRNQFFKFLSNQYQIDRGTIEIMQNVWLSGDG